MPFRVRESMVRAQSRHRHDRRVMAGFLIYSCLGTKQSPLLVPHDQPINQPPAHTHWSPLAQQTAPTAVSRRTSPSTDTRSVHNHPGTIGGTTTETVGAFPHWVRGTWPRQALMSQEGAGRRADRDPVRLRTARMFRRVWRVGRIQSRRRGVGECR
jgi:hypothetical protein